MAEDPKRDAPRHPPHPGDFPDRASGKDRRGSRTGLIIGLVVVVLVLGWLLFGGGTTNDQDLGQPAGVGAPPATEATEDAPPPDQDMPPPDQ